MYTHIVQYYETDKMGITHHSNYIRWMEEARVDFLDKIGFNFARLESEGIVSPVISVSCKYIKPTTFSDIVNIDVKVKSFNKVKLLLQYIMTNEKGEKVLEGESEHCFLNESGKPVVLSKDFPDFNAKLLSLLEKD